ncbi:hypothetical protein V8C86DRAFT_1257481 [Haematococcus lacustris]
MAKQSNRSDASVVSTPVEAPSTSLGLAPRTSLMGLPTELLRDVARRAIQLGAGGALSLTCRAFSNTNLSHAPSLHIQLNSPGCDQFLSGRSQFQLFTPIDAVLRARTCKLALALEHQQDQHTGEYIMLVANVLKKLGSCAAVEACKLGSLQGPSLVPPEPLSFSPDLAQCLVGSFPSLTSLSFHGYEIPCRDLATLLSHPQLALQLQQLDLNNTTITNAERSEPGAATLDNPFQASSLKQLSLFIQGGVGEHEPLLPNLQPLSSHLTQLCILHEWQVVLCLKRVIVALQPLAQLQVLTFSDRLPPPTLPAWDLEWLPGLLQALPRLHTLQLPGVTVRGQQQLNTLLAATQLTSIQLRSVEGLPLMYVDCEDVPCSWQRLELTGSVDCFTVARLPLHSLTQPLVLEELVIGSYCDCDEVEDAVHNLTQACRVPVRFKALCLYMSDVSTAAEQHVQLQELVAELQALNHCREKVWVTRMNVGAADVLTLAPLCQVCTQLEFAEGSVTPSLEFWRHLMQLMPTVTDVVFGHVEGSTSSAMHESLQLMADQPWARWLDICITRHPCSPELPACWLADNPSKPGKLRVWLEA